MRLCTCVQTVQWSNVQRFQASSQASLRICLRADLTSKQSNDSLDWYKFGRHPCTAYCQGQTQWRHTPAIRLDHIWWTPTSSLPFRILSQHYGVGPPRPDSDHMPLEMRILLSVARGSAVYSISMWPPVQHNPTWIWDGLRAKQEQHALALQAGPCQASLQQSSEAAAVGDLHRAIGHFNSTLKTAAQMAGLRQTRLQSSRLPSCQPCLELTQGVLCSGPICGMSSFFLQAAQGSES